MELINLIGPVFALIVTGYLFSLTGVFGEDTAEELVKFAVYVLIPALMFYLIGQEDAKSLLNAGFYLAYGLPVLLVFALLFFALQRRLGWNSGEAAIVAFASVASNTGFVALPILHSLFGQKGALPAALANLVMVILVFLLSILLETAAAREKSEEPAWGPRSSGAGIGHLAWNVVKNPIVLGTLAGIAYAFTGLGFAPVVTDYLDLLAGGLTPVALFAIGLSTGMGAILRSGPLIGAVALIKLVLLPGLILAAARLVGLDPLWTVAAVVSAAVPTAKNAFLLAEHYKRNKDLAAHTISVTTLLSIASLIAWLLLLSRLYPGTFQLN